MAQTMTSTTLETENRQYTNTGGVSCENWDLGFIPGFLDQETGLIYLSCWTDGNIAPMHLLDGLPEHLVLDRHPSGRVSTIKGSVIAGFIRDGHFYTRKQAANAEK